MIFFLRHTKIVILFAPDKSGLLNSLIIYFGLYVLPIYSRKLSKRFLSFCSFCFVLFFFLISVLSVRYLFIIFSILQKFYRIISTVIQSLII